jgi:hypothetical protein
MMNIPLAKVERSLLVDCVRERANAQEVHQQFKKEKKKSYKKNQVNCPTSIIRYFPHFFFKTIN